MGKAQTFDVEGMAKCVARISGPGDRYQMILSWYDPDTGEEYRAAMPLPPPFAENGSLGQVPDHIFNQVLNALMAAAPHMPLPEE